MKLLSRMLSRAFLGLANLFEPVIPGVVSGDREGGGKQTLRERELFISGINNCNYALGNIVLCKRVNNKPVERRYITIKVRDDDGQAMIALDREAAELIARNLYEGIIKSKDIVPGTGTWKGSNQTMQLHEIYNHFYGIGSQANDDTPETQRKETLQ